LSIGRPSDLRATLSAFRALLPSLPTLMSFQLWPFLLIIAATKSVSGEPLIHHHNVPAFERRYEELFNKEEHRLSINRPGDTQAGTDALQAQGANRGHVAAMISWHVVEHPLARSGATVQSGQAEIAAHLVNEDEVLTRQTIREFTKLLANLLVPLTGDEAFFSEEGSAPVSPGKSWTD
jgi:hypothetical protein